MLLVDDDDQVPDFPTVEEAALMESLASDALSAIDNAILAAAGPHWLKVARVVADAIEVGGYPMVDEQVQLHVRRIVNLVRARLLEAQGNLLRPRFSEIRLPQRAQ